MLKGTPTVDGKVDEIYKQSLTIVYDGDPDKNKSNQQWFVGSMTTYALYDENYVYVIADVKDDDVVSADKNWIMTNTNPYQNDTVEFRFTYKGTPGIQFKVGVATAHTPSSPPSAISPRSSIRLPSPMTAT